jgi:DNA modification methylase
MFADPPYGVQYDAEWREKAGIATMGEARKGKVTSDDRSDWTEVWKAWPCSVFYVWHAAAFADVVMQSLRSADCEVRQQIIWGKTIAAIGRSAYHWQHEPCWYAVRKGSTAHWIGDRKQTTLWTEPSPLHIMSGSKDERTPHPTQKPVALAERAIANHVEPGGAVADAFGGSGSTLIAAAKLGRRAFLAELDPKYVDVIRRRWTKLAAELGLAAGPGALAKDG